MDAFCNVCVLPSAAAAVAAFCCEQVVLWLFCHFFLDSDTDLCSHLARTYTPISSARRFKTFWPMWWNVCESTECHWLCIFFKSNEFWQTRFYRRFVESNTVAHRELRTRTFQPQTDFIYARLHSTDWQSERESIQEICCVHPFALGCWVLVSETRRLAHVET